jgi:hypothetical protein
MMAERLEINPAVVDKVLNHRSGVVRGVAAVYQRGQYLKERKAALSRWGDFLKNLLPNYNQKTVNIQKNINLIEFGHCNAAQRYAVYWPA